MAEAPNRSNGPVYESGSQPRQPMMVPKIEALARGALPTADGASAMVGTGRNQGGPFQVVELDPQFMDDKPGVPDDKDFL